jgi:hypothetical protein
MKQASRSEMSAAMATFLGTDVGTCWHRTARRGLAAAKRPTAVFASSDEIATGCLEITRADGLKIPGDLPIVASTMSARSISSTRHSQQSASPSRSWAAGESSSSFLKIKAALRPPK